MNEFIENYQPNISTILFSDSERDSGICGDSKLRQAVQSFHSDGVVILENIFSQELISSLYHEYVIRNQRYFSDDLYDDALHVGNKRMMLQVEIDGVFNNQKLYFHPFLATILLNLLGKIFVVGGFGSVVSLPGAGAQHIHRDSGQLFEEMEGNVVLPPFAITVAIPLIPLTKKTGSTRIYPGSHRASIEEAPAMKYFDPEIPVGSLVMWDYTVFHGGLANRSNQVRPLLYLSYCKQWFRDPNYHKHSPIKMSELNYSLIPEVLKPLFAWSRPTTTYAEETHDLNSPCPCFSGKKYKDCHGRQ